MSEFWQFVGWWGVVSLLFAGLWSWIGGHRRCCCPECTVDVEQV